MNLKIKETQLKDSDLLSADMVDCEIEKLLFSFFLVGINQNHRLTRTSQSDPVLSEGPSADLNTEVKISTFTIKARVSMYAIMPEVRTHVTKTIYKFTSFYMSEMVWMFSSSAIIAVYGMTLIS